MEEDDELVPEPDNKVEIPPEIGELLLLRELIGSFNKIQTIPKELGRLKRLRRLILNTNRIRFIPPELGGLDMLEEIIFSENLIEEIPASIAKIPNLKLLRISNNKLKSLPFDMADVLTLEEFDCGNNPHLETVPAKWRGDTESVLFTCKVHREYNVKMGEMLRVNHDLTSHAQFVEQDNLLLKEKVLLLEAKIDDLAKNMPKKIMRRMEDQAKRQREMELSLENDEDRKKSGCVVS